MFKRITALALCVIFLFSLVPTAAFAGALGAGDSVYSNETNIADGFTYTNSISFNSRNQREESFFLTRTADSDVYPIVMACDTIYGGMTVSKMTAYAEKLGYNVVAAVNSDMFSTSTKVPLGIVIENGRYKSSPEGEPALCFTESGEAFIVSPPEITITLVNNGNPNPPELPEVGENEEDAESGETGNSGETLPDVTTAVPEESESTENNTDGAESEPEAGASDAEIPEESAAEGPAADEVTEESVAGEDAAGETAEEKPVFVDNTGKTVELTHFNKARNDVGGLYLFDSSFSTVSTRTSSAGWMVRFKILEGEMSVSGTMQLEVTELYTGADAQPIGEEYMILTAASVGGKEEEFKKFAVGDLVTLTTVCSDQSLEDAEWATGAADIIVFEGAATDTVNSTGTLASRNPRTAVGIKEDGTVVTYVVDGRRTSYSNGLTYKELAQELIDMGCVSAVNLDGGGSAVMSVRMPGYASAKPVSSPSDGSERSCGAYILFVTDAVSDSKPSSLYLENDGAFILAGTSFELGFHAMDAGYKSVTAPADIFAESSVGAVIENGIYTAADTAGKDTLTLESGDVSGVGTVNVITTPDSISVKNAQTGKKITSLKLERGESVQFEPVSTYISRNVISDVGSYTYTVTGDIGTVTETGLFTASEHSGKTGEIVVAAGETQYTIQVSVPAVLEDVSGHWAEDYIFALYENGVVNGTTETTYEPDSLIKRGDFILMLYRAAGRPAQESMSSFTDVPEDAYYASAVAWAEGAGIALGTGDGTFLPETALSRQQAFTFVVRAFPSLGIEYTEAGPEAIEGFFDAADIAEFATKPTATLVSMGIIGGSEGYLTPLDNFSRGQMAKVLSLALGMV